MQQSFFAGPFIGKKTSTIILSKDELIIRKHSVKESWIYGLFGISSTLFDEHLNKKIDRNTINQILKDSNFSKYSLLEIEKIELIHSCGRNKISIYLKNGSEFKFSILERGKTEFYFSLFSENYPELTVELNRPETIIQKLFKY